MRTTYIIYYFQFQNCHIVEEFNHFFFISNRVKLLPSTYLDVVKVALKIRPCKTITRCEMYPK